MDMCVSRTTIDEQRARLSAAVGWLTTALPRGVRRALRACAAYGRKGGRADAAVDYI